MSRSWRVWAKSPRRWEAGANLEEESWWGQLSLRLSGQRSRAKSTLIAVVLLVILMVIGQNSERNGKGCH